MIVEGCKYPDLRARICPPPLILREKQFGMFNIVEE
jgi:hypothetical protein